MRRKLKNLKNKSGHSDASPRQMIDEATYREHGAAVNSGTHDGPGHSGWSWATRPRDLAINIRKHFASSTVPSGPT